MLLHQIYRIRVSGFRVPEFSLADIFNLGVSEKSPLSCSPQRDQSRYDLAEGQLARLVPTERDLCAQHALYAARFFCCEIRVINLKSSFQIVLQEYGCAIGLLAPHHRVPKISRRIGRRAKCGRGRASVPTERMALRRARMRAACAAMHAPGVIFQ